MQLLQRHRFVADSYRCMDCMKPQGGSSGYPSVSRAAFLVCSITVVLTLDCHHPMPCIALFIANIFYSATFEHHRVLQIYAITFFSRRLNSRELKFSEWYQTLK